MALSRNGEGEYGCGHFAGRAKALASPENRRTLICGLAGDGDEWSDPPAPGHLGVDHEDRHIRQECRQQRPVQIGDMVGDDQQSGFVMWVMLPAV